MGTKSPKAHLRFQGPQLSRASRVSGQSKIKEVQGLPHKSLTSKGPFSPSFRAQGLKPPQGHLGFSRISISRTSTRASTSKNLSNLSGLKGLRVLFSQFWGAQRLKIPKWASRFSWVQFSKGLQDFQVEYKVFKGISFTIPDQKIFQSFKRVSRVSKFQGLSMS